ncbi:MAG: hypothetical protein ACTSU5_15470 [Promethearchaeota archaeon]
MRKARVARYSAGLGPLLAVLGYVAGKSLWVSWKLGESQFLIVLAYALALATVVTFLLGFEHIAVVRALLGVVCLAFGVLAVLVFSMGEFRILYTVFACGLWTGAFGAWLLADVVKALAGGSTGGSAGGRRERVVSKRARAAGIVTVSLFALASLLYTSPLYTATTHEFTVTDEQAGSYDLVLYWGGQTAMNETLVDVCRDANATLSFNMLESYFGYNDSVGNHCAEVVRYANSVGVKVEVWPLFAPGNGHYPSYSESDRVMGLYEAFHNWTLVNGIEVDYVLWDIESEAEGSSYDGWAKDIAVLGDLGGWVHGLEVTRQRARNWTAVLGLWDAMLKKASADGYTSRATTHAIPFDLLDGDSDLQMYGGLPAYDLLGDYQYISMMVYRGCEGGGNASREYLYQNVRTLDAAIPGYVAVCMGCINYAPYRTAGDVVNDVRLALAAGANSVRVFQGQSWVAGHGSVPGHGFEGLRELLLEARKGGTASYTTNFEFETWYSWNAVGDVVADFARA